MSYNPYSLEGKIILVTGASSGIGKATALECAKMGASVIVTGRNENRLRDVFDNLPKTEKQSHLMVVADMGTDEGLDKLTDNLPPLDGISDNAGISNGNKPVKFIKDEELMDVLNANTLSHVRLARALFKKKLINKNGSYVITASIGGNTSHVTGQAVYGISKSAVNSFMQYCAIEFASRGIRCNSVCPGMIKTPLIHVDTLTEEDMVRDADKYPLKRYGEPEEVARVNAFLLSDASSYMTGAALIVDGGYSINH